MYVLHIICLYRNVSRIVHEIFHLALPIIVRPFYFFVLQKTPRSGSTSGAGMGNTSMPSHHMRVTPMTWLTCCLWTLLDLTVVHQRVEIGCRFRVDWPDRLKFNILRQFFFKLEFQKLVLLIGRIQYCNLRDLVAFFANFPSVCIHLKI